MGTGSRHGTDGGTNQLVKGHHLPSELWITLHMSTRAGDVSMEIQGIHTMLIVPKHSCHARHAELAWYIAMQRYATRPVVRVGVVSGHLSTWSLQKLCLAIMCSSAA